MEPPIAEVELIEALLQDIRRTTLFPAHASIVRTTQDMWQAEFAIGEFPRWSGGPLHHAPTLAQSDLIERLGAPWPRCPEHGRHPLEYVPQGHREGPTFVFEEASWRCPLLPMVGARIGSLPDPEPYVDEPLPDGTIRWWLDGGGFGAIADSGGDVWFLWASVEGRTGWPRFREGERVAYEVDEGRQGAYRRARRVRKIGA